MSQIMKIAPGFGSRILGRLGLALGVRILIESRSLGTMTDKVCTIEVTRVIEQTGIPGMTGMTGTGGIVDRTGTTGMTEVTGITGVIVIATGDDLGIAVSAIAVDPVPLDLLPRNVVDLRMTLAPQTLLVCSRL